MIIRDGTDPKIEKYKATIGITGDVYIIEDAKIESLESHKRLISSHGFFPQATTIEEAEQERAWFEQELERRREEEQQEDEQIEEMRQKAEAYDIIVGGVDNESD